MLTKWAQWLSRRWAVVLGLTLVLTVGAGWYENDLFSHLQGETLLSDGADSTLVDKETARLFPAANPDAIVEVVGDQSAAGPFWQAVGQSDWRVVSQLPADDGSAVFYFLSGSDLDGLRARAADSAAEIKIGGRAAVLDELMTQIKQDLRRSETISFIVLAGLLVLVFGSLAAAAVPLLTGAVSILLSLAIVRGLASIWPISVFSINVLTFLGLGLAIDYGLFIVSRYREELSRQSSPQAALAVSLATAGRTVLFSGSIVMLSLLGLFFFSAPFLKSVGLGGVLAVLVSVVVSLSVLPALLVAWGPRLNWGRVRRLPKQKDDGGFWSAIARFVVRRAGWVLAGVLGLLVALGAPFLRVNLQLTDAHSLPAHFASRQVADNLRQLVPATNQATLTVLVEFAGSPLTAGRLAALAEWQQQVAATPGVTGIVSVLAADYLPNNQRDRLIAQYAQENTALLTVTTNGDDDQRVVRELRSLAAPSGATVRVGGVAAQLVDLTDDLSANWPAAAILIAASTFILLLFMLGSIWVPVKAILLNVLSLSASFGLMVWIFQDGHGAGWLQFSSNGSIEAALPVLIFAVAFGLAMDYEVFLVSRIKERADAGADTPAAVADGLQRTGSIITSAAALLLVVIGAFAASSVMTIKQVGVGLSIAVIIDATLVRTLLVPATMYFLGEYNWWLPRWLKRIVRRVGRKESH